MSQWTDGGPLPLMCHAAGVAENRVMTRKSGVPKVREGKTQAGISIRSDRDLTLSDRYSGDFPRCLLVACETRKLLTNS